MYKSNLTNCFPFCNLHTFTIQTITATEQQPTPSLATTNNNVYIIREKRTFVPEPNTYIHSHRPTQTQSHTSLTNSAKFKRCRPHLRSPMHQHTVRDSVSARLATVFRPAIRPREPVPKRSTCCRTGRWWTSTTTITSVVAAVTITRRIIGCRHTSTIMDRRRPAANTWPTWRWTAWAWRTAACCRRWNAARWRAFSVDWAQRWVLDLSYMESNVCLALMSVRALTHKCDDKLLLGRWLNQLTHKAHTIISSVFVNCSHFDV